MTTAQRPGAYRSRAGGQTLIIALLILSTMLIFGFVFLGYVRQTVVGTQTSQTRNLSDDLSQAGIRYAQSQLVDGPLGADWRGTPTLLAPTGVNLTTDPDAYYLRPGTYLPFRPGSPQLDLGGPDGLGPFIRVNFSNGRALVRVRYAPSDANLFSSNPNGPLRNIGAVRNYLIIESIGRQGVVNPNDPTTMTTGGPVQFTGFTSTAQLQQALAVMAKADSEIINGRHLVAFASIGVTESARFITNKFHVNRPAEIGVSSDLGAVYTDGTNIVPVASQLAYELGTPGSISNSLVSVPPGFGSLDSNANVEFYGNVVANLNYTFGDAIDIDGSVSAQPGATLTLNVDSYNAANGLWTTTTQTAPSLDSRNPNFSTLFGLIRDGVAQTDSVGNPRGVGRKSPPSLLQVDPATNETRYLEITRDSGAIVNGVNSGEFGHGGGVFVDNSSDRQEPEDQVGKAALGAADPLIDDWLNPGSGQTNSGWQGPFYVPVGAFLQLRSDGFSIQRDDQTWKNPDGKDSSLNLIRYRIGYGSDGNLHIIDTLTIDPKTGGRVQIDATNPNFDAGPVFNGVLYFEGNVRVRGVIPTDVQLTVVSNATIYVEGSILKGIVGTNVTATEGAAPLGGRLTRPSRSMLMLAATDYVCINTSQFFGAENTQNLKTKDDQPGGSGYNALDIPNNGGSLSLVAEFPLDPNSSVSPNNPSSLLPFVLTYKEGNNPSQPLAPQFLFTHTMSVDGPGSAAFASMNVNYGIGNAAYQFSANDNLVAQLITPTDGSVPIYGLGDESWQRYDKFETRNFPLLDPNSGFYNFNGISIALNTNSDPNGFLGDFTLLTQDSNDFRLYTNPLEVQGGANDYLLARAAIVPQDVRIEASLFAENGSLFVLPGPWFNPNPNDRRDAYMQSSTDPATRNLLRLENYGSYPYTPFYGEPMDVRIDVVGSVSENMPQPMAVQNEWMRKWGWIPTQLGATGQVIPTQHIPNGFSSQSLFVPNLFIQYDPVLATDRTGGFNLDNNPNTLIRTDSYGRALPPLPRLPVGPHLVYFGNE